MYTNGVTQNEIDFLLVHLVRSPRVLKVAIDKLQPEHFNQVPYEHPYQLIWAITQDYYLAHNKLIPKETMQLLIGKRTENAFEFQMIMPAIMQLVELVYVYPESDLDAEFVIKSILQPFLDERALRPALQAALDGEAQDTLTNVQTAFTQSRLNSLEPVKIFDLENPNLKQRSRAVEPTGSALFDKMTAGGYRPGHITGVLAPTGGGKTLLAIELMAQMALQKQHAYMFHYEQQVEQNIQFRLWSHLTGIPTSVFENNTIDKLAPDVYEKLEQYRWIDEYLHIYDMQKGSFGFGGYREIEACLSEVASRGEPPKLVVLDWLGQMVKRYCAGNNLDLERYRFSVYDESLSAFKSQIAGQFQTELVVFHQLNAESAKKKRGLTESYDAAEFKQFAVLMDTCIQIGRASHENIAKVGVSKQRGERSECHIRLHGATCRIEIIDGEYQVMEWQDQVYLIPKHKGGGASMNNRGFS